MIYLLSFLGIAAFWLACGFVAAGMVYDKRDAWAAFICGFAALMVNGLLLRGYRYGWRKWW